MTSTGRCPSPTSLAAARGESGMTVTSPSPSSSAITHALTRFGERVRSSLNHDQVSDELERLLTDGRARVAPLQHGWPEHLACPTALPGDRRRHPLPSPRRGDRSIAVTCLVRGGSASTRVNGATPASGPPKPALCWARPLDWRSLAGDVHPCAKTSGNSPISRTRSTVASIRASRSCGDYSRIARRSPTRAT